MKRVWASLTVWTILVGTASLFGQEPAPQPRPRDNARVQEAIPAPPNADCCEEVRQELAKLETRLSELKQTLEKHEKGITTVTKGLGVVQTKIKSHDGTINQHTGDLAAIRKQLDDLEEKFLQVARLDPETNRYVPILYGNMQASRAFREEVGTATQGRIVVDNSTGSDRFVYINGVRWRVLPGKSFVNVPIGIVMVQRPGHAEEKLHEWKLDHDQQGYFVEYSLTHGVSIRPRFQ